MANLWLAEEDFILKENYHAFGPEVVALELKKNGYERSPAAVKNRAQALGLYYRGEYASWTREELNILREFYPIEGKKVMNRLPDKSLKNIQITAHRMGIKKEKTNK